MSDTEENNSLNHEDILIADELNKIQIEQLHKATLNFSGNSLETKKLCVTVEIAALTSITGIYKNLQLEDLIGIIKIFAFIVPLLFYLVDIVFYFYQNRLREKMIIEENEIRRRHHLSTRYLKTGSKFSRLLHSVFNKSQIMYWGLIVLPFIPQCVYKFFLRFI